MKDIKRNLTMLCDYYELTMANGYFQNGESDKICYFDLYFRSVPDDGGFAIMAGTGKAAENGILIKSAEALENLSSVDTVVLDKTGTITKGRLSVSDIYVANGVEKEQMLGLAAAVEGYSEHPIAKAVCDKAHELSLTKQRAEEFRMVAGGGVEAIVAGEKLCCGTVRFVEEALGKTISQEIIDEVGRFSAMGKATLVVASGSRALGVIAFSDEIREEAKECVRALKEAGITAVLITGDNSRAAEFIAKEVGIEQVFSEQLPEDKVQRVVDLQMDKHIVAMVGDGVNDAPSIKLANVGVAMGSFGSDIAIEASDIALMSDRLSLVVYLRRLALATFRTIRTNIIISMTVNFVAIIFSVMGLLTPVTGALVHNVSSLLVVINAALLYDRDA